MVDTRLLAIPWRVTLSMSSCWRMLPANRGEMGVAEHTDVVVVSQAARLSVWRCGRGSVRVGSMMCATPKLVWEGWSKSLSDVELEGDW